MTSLLEVKNLSISFHHEEGYSYRVVKDISFELNKGEILGIVGESGSGKSLTALSIVGLLPYPKAFHSKESSIRFNGTELINNPNIRQYRGKNISFIFQEPMSSLNPLHTIGSQIAETLLINQKISKAEAQKKVIELLKMTGIQNAEAKIKAYPHELSGGQRQRVMIAMAIANNPDILIADEPTTALDVTIAAEIIDLLIKLKKELGMSIIFISHDLNVIRKIADNVLVMKSGKIIERNSCKEIFENPVQSYTKKLIYTYNRLKYINNNETKSILSLKNITVKYPLTKNFFGKVTSYLHAVDHVSLDLKEGKTVGLVGESGSGKTTLGMAATQLTAYEGNILLADKSIEAFSPQELRKTIQIIFQDPYNSLNPRMTVEEIVGEGLRVHFPHLSATEKREKIKQTLEEVGLNEETLFKYPHEFSGGQRQRIAIARALVVEPKILILDEPTSALDATIASHVLNLLNKLQKEHRLSYLFISHDMNAIRAVSDEIAIMKNGKIIEQNTAIKILKNPQEPYTKKLIRASNLREDHERRNHKKYHNYYRQIQRPQKKRVD